LTPSRCAYPFSITSLETGQTIKVNAFTQGTYPLFCSTAPGFTATLEFFQAPNYEVFYGNPNNIGTTRIYFLNTPQRWHESAYQGTPLSYWGNFNFTVANVPVLLVDNSGAPFGNGMQAINAVTLKRINSIDLTMFPTTAFAAITTILFQLIEQGGNSGPYIRWIWRQSMPANQTTLYQRQVQFPHGLLQFDPSNSFAVNINPLPPAGSWGIDINIQYDQLIVGT